MQAGPRDAATKVTCAVEAGLCIAGFFRIFGCSALILSATAAAWFPWFPQAALAVSKVKIAGTAKVTITNIPTAIW